MYKTFWTPQTVAESGLIKPRRSTAADASFFPSPSIRMRLFKKSKKSRQPSQQPMSLLVPTQIAVGPLTASADLDKEDLSRGAFRSNWNRETDWIDLTIAPGENSGRTSRVSLRDVNVVQRPRPSGASTSTRQPEGDITRTCTLPQPI